LLLALCPLHTYSDPVDELIAHQYYQLALSAMERGDLAKAESRLRKVTKAVPEWPQGHNMLGFALQQQGNTEGALAAYRKAQGLDPHNAFSWYALKALGSKPDSAAPACVTEDAWTKYHAGLVLLTKEERKKAQRTLFEAARSAPDWVDVRNTLAYLYERHHTAAEALREAEAVLQIAPRDLYARNVLAELKPKASGGSASPSAADSLKRPEWAGDARNEEYEQRLFALVNEERRNKGLPELLADDTLTKVAREHSGEMRDKGYFAHESPTRGRREPIDRYMLYASRKPKCIAENVARRWGSRPSLNAENMARTHEDLMKSKYHRDNILRKEVTHLGVGIASNEKGDYWVTQVFAKPR